MNSLMPLMKPMELMISNPYDEPFELDYETPGKYYYDGGSMVALRERLNATSDDTLIALANILPDSPTDFTIDSITLTLTD